MRGSVLLPKKPKKIPQHDFVSVAENFAQRFYFG
jgi:hypothetical protein